jgi:hypothetical protein
MDPGLSTFRTGDLNFNDPNDISYGGLFANQFDLPWIGNSMIEVDDWDLTMPDWNENLQVPDEAPRDQTDAGEGTPVQPSGTATPNTAKTNPVVPTQRQVELYAEIEVVEDSIRDAELQDTSPEELLSLRLRKARLWLELKRLQDPSGARGKTLVLLELEKVTLHIEDMTKRFTHDQLDEEADFWDAKARRIRLRNELKSVSGDVEKPNSTTIVQRPGINSQDPSVAGAVSEPLRPPPSVTLSEALSSKSVLQPSTPKRAHPDSAGTPSTSVLSSMPSHRLLKRIRANGVRVRGRGGQCLNCKSNRSKPACLGEPTCDQCKLDKTECIRPSLKDKNVFSLRLDLFHEIHIPHEPGSRPKKDFVSEIIREFFDISGHPFLQRHPETIVILDQLYSEIVLYGFDADVSSARIAALHGPCAFNVFVKSNTVINNLYLPFIEESMENRLRETVEIDLLTNLDTSRQMSDDEIQQNLLLRLELKKVESVRHLEVLRALSSESVFQFLEELLREINIRDCRGFNQLPKKASLLAAVGLTLEQVLNFADSASRTKTLDSELKAMLRQLGLVLLNYLEPPSALAFPPSVKINDCFGRDESHITGVFMEDSFWYELYKACSKAIPTHLLQVVTKKDALNDPVARARSPITLPIRMPPSALEMRQRYGAQMQDYSHSIMGMNLRTSGDRVGMTPTGTPPDWNQTQIGHNLAATPLPLEQSFLMSILMRPCHLLGSCPTGIFQGNIFRVV